MAEELTPKQAEKKMFIEDVLEGLKLQLVADIDKMPDEWDGWEMRQHIVDKTQEQVGYMRMNNKRMAEYKNDKLILNL